METLQKPELIHLEEGKSLKTYYIKGSEGTRMPLHHATMEAVLIVQEGEAMLALPDARHLLIPGISHIIPAGVKHSLEIYKDFRAFVIMALDSNIKFDQLAAD